ncbi:MAG TPA: hypothetical protein PLH29_01680 [bacterium]|nr:hypothetical protein [bacterium]
MMLNKKTEERIKKEAYKFIHKGGRNGWDDVHTLCAAKWMKKLIAKEGGDQRILIPAIYFHDTGYPNLGKRYSYNQVMKAKLNHARIAGKNVRKVLPKLGFCKEEINRISYLVENHDKHNNIKEKDRQLVFEADGLAQIDWRQVKPTFSKEDTIRFLKEYYKERKKYMKTKTGKKYLKELMRATKIYLKNWK